MAVNRRVTIATIARSAGVSPATVSRALNHPELVNAKTLGRINASIRSLGYGGPVEQYREGSSDCRGLVVVNLPWLDNPFYSEIVHGVRVAARDAGYDMLISWDNITNETASSFCSMLRRCGASGVITTSPLSAEAIQAVEGLVPSCSARSAAPTSTRPTSRSTTAPPRDAPRSTSSPAAADGSPSWRAPTTSSSRASASRGFST